MKHKKIVDIPTGITTEICTNLQGTISVKADGYLKAKYLNYPKTMEPLEINEIEVEFEEIKSDK